LGLLVNRFHALFTNDSSQIVPLALFLFLNVDAVPFFLRIVLLSLLGLERYRMAAGMTGVEEEMLEDVH
jgi:hypothetical protein